MVWLASLWLSLWRPSAFGQLFHFPEPSHGLLYTNPATVWDEAMPLGNGALGALVWGDGHPVKISLDRTDLWDLSPVPEFSSAEYGWPQMRQWHSQGKDDGLKRLYEKPYGLPAPTKIPAGRIEIELSGETTFQKAFLNLRDASAQLDFSPGLRMRVFTHALKPVGFIQVEQGRGGGTTEAVNGIPIIARLVPPPFSGQAPATLGGSDAGGLAQLGYPAPVVSAGPNFQNYFQPGTNGFSFAVALRWKKEDQTWLGAWSIASSLESPDPLETANARAEEALRGSYMIQFVDHRAWWRDYWYQSSVSLPNALLERQWYLEQYKFGSASRRGSPPVNRQGPWTADNGGLPPWKGDYRHDLNTQLSYWPGYAGNHLDEGLALLDWLWITRSNCLSWTRRFYGLPGLNVPGAADLKNNPIGGWPQYAHSATTGAWLAQHFYWHWKFSADRDFLKTRAFPYLRDASQFLEAFTVEKDSAGRRTLPLSSSPEINDNRPEAWFKTVTNHDLALARWLFSATSELADELKMVEEAAHWRTVLLEMPEFSLGDDGRLLVAQNVPLPDSHRHLSHLMAIHPLGLIDPSQGRDAIKTMEASVRDLDRLGTDAWCGYSYAWFASLLARLHEGERAERSLEIFCSAFTLRNSFHCNGDQSGKGYSKFTGRPFTLEGNFAMAAGLQEMLLQSHRGRIEVFPAIPSHWTNVSFTTLRAQGAFLVSAGRRDGQTTQVIIQAEKNGKCRVLSPFNRRELVYPMLADQTLILTAQDTILTDEWSKDGEGDDVPARKSSGKRKKRGPVLE